MKQKLIFLFTFYCYTSLFAQIDYSANDIVIPYEGHFRAGMNFGNYPGFDEIQQANLAAGNSELQITGIGAKSIRPALYEEYFSYAGYEAQVPIFTHYDRVGLQDNTLIIGFPSMEKRDSNFYCDKEQSTLFANLYEPIWDDGSDGTPYNEDNYYAAYLYKTVALYGDKIRFWEIWNEPGFDFTSNRGWLNPGQDGNWWDNNPDPCDYKLRAPIFHYVRLLRISYEVIKSLQPEDYVVVSGTGYMSFLDAILRNTDNPDDGSVTAEYPLGGGAYFDVMGYHAYPHFDGSLREYSDELSDFIYYRHSDAAAKGIETTQDSFQMVLANYGYDNQVFPTKEWLITECNLPRRAFGNFIGSEDAQRNFITKAVVTCMQNNIHQLHLYKLAEDTKYDKATFEFDLMGMYKNMDFRDGYFQKANEAGVAYKTSTDLLFGKRYDEAATAALDLAPNIGGGAFRDDINGLVYVLWAKTDTDQSETAQATFSFPNELNLTRLIRREWNFTQTHNTTEVNPQTIHLTASPAYFSAPKIIASHTSGCAPLTIDFSVDANPTYRYEWQILGADISTANTPDITATFMDNGSNNVLLKTYDNNNNLLFEEITNIQVSTPSVPNFDYRIDGPQVFFENTSSLNSDTWLWDFGDGTTSTKGSPHHVFFQSGTYLVSLTTSNQCGSELKQIEIEITVPSTTQISTTANDTIKAYPYPFRAGSNFKFYPNWIDEQLGDIAAGNALLGVEGAGVKALRTTLPHYFLEGWTYDIRLETFQHYQNLDLRNNTVIVGLPNSEAQETTSYCPDNQSIVFKDIYLDIWDDGENGTPINDDNDYALYLYKTVETYKDYVTFWEIWNSPGFDITGEKGYLPPGEAGNWWENNPDPCDYAMHAPIYHYVRLLRISYEIIKTLDPDGYVTVSGIGFPSFLDAILRNTDNPSDGAIAAGYPLQGGAYFDAVGYNTFPHIDGSTSYYDLDISGFAYRRHSDAAITGISRIKKQFEQVLDKYGYNGEEHPEKLWMIGESNVARAPFNNYIGGEQAQRNFAIKAYVEAMKNDLKQFYIYSLAEDKQATEANSENDLMGLYQTLNDVLPYQQTINEQGVAYKTVSDLLFGTQYDEVKTRKLNLPENIGGVSLKDKLGNYTHVLWAKTQIDYSEVASGVYTFPLDMNLEGLTLREWDWSVNQEEYLISSQNIPLTSTPIFLSEAASLLPPPIAAYTVEDIPHCANTPINFYDLSKNATSWEWTFIGGDPTFSTEQNPIVAYSSSGSYPVTLIVQNAAGEHSYTAIQDLQIEAQPQANFTYEVNAPYIQFINLSTHYQEFFWDFGNGDTGVGFNPRVFYYYNGTYEVTLVAKNDCNSDTLRQFVTVENLPKARFTHSPKEDCEDLEVRFIDQSTASPTSWHWSFPNAVPNESTDQHPFTTFLSSGTYDIQLIVSNDLGRDTIVQKISIGHLIENISIALCEGESITIDGQTFDVNHPTGQIVYPEVTPQGCDSTIVVQVHFLPDYYTEIYDTLTAEQTELESGVYTQNFTSVNGCDSIVVNNLTVLNTTSTNKINPPIHFTATPNPFYQEVNFTLLGVGNDFSIEIFDLNGRLVKQLVPSDLTWDSSSQEAGIYFAQLIYAQKVRTIKLVKL